MMTSRTAASPMPSLSSLLSLLSCCKLLLLLATFPTSSHAIFEEDVGQLDFLIRTTGHGPPSMESADVVIPFVAVVTSDNEEKDDDSVVLTSDAASNGQSTTPTSCYIACRKVKDGSLVWRRNVCSSSSSSTSTTTSQQSHAVAISSGNANTNNVYTVDHNGSIRAWDAWSGALVWDESTTASSTSSSIWTFAKDSNEYVAVSGDSSATITVLDAATGQPVEENISNDAQKSRPSADAASNKSNVVCSKAGGSGLEIALYDGDDTDATDDNSSRRKSFFRFGFVGGSGGSNFQQKGDLGLTGDDDDATSITMLSCMDDTTSILITSKRGTTKQITFKISAKDVTYKTTWETEEGLGFQTSSTILLDSSHYVGYDLDTESGMKLLSFQSRLQMQYQRLVGLFKGLVKGFTIGKNDSSNDNDENDNIHNRIHVFGFVKTATFVSQSSHRLYGMDTTGKNRRGTIRYVVDLPFKAQWHRLIHGVPSNSATTTTTGDGAAVADSDSSSSSRSLGGIHGESHNRDVLILSLLQPDGGDSEEQNQQTFHWMCVDAGSGTVHNQGGTVKLSSPLAQVIPMMGVMPCRQSALLLTRDGDLVAIPDTPETTKLINNQLELKPNGFYAHSINKEDGVFESFLLSPPPATKDDNQFESQMVGSVVFPGEEVVRVVYPKRDEVISSPCNVLGDESLLLKYINPHLVVIITMKSDDEDEVNGEDHDSKLFSDAIKASRGKGKQKRKPVGATSPTSVETSAQSSTDEDQPNLFVNVVDSVSGRILYRASHANAISSPTPPTAVMSENWIFYSFANAKTRRAEIGVLSLYEGMIDSKGLTAFASPEQSTTFSSLDARESKPVVLSKSYSIAKPVTAMAVTSTRSGISTRRLVLAGVDGQIHTIDRKALEPRRPLGELKDTEKKEGLAQYSELIPTVPYFSLSSNRTVEAVTGILTAPTDLESQSLILAYGGPDLFFTRTSPSRGFDLLPDSFNRVLLSIVVAALMVILVVVRQRVSKKYQKQGWSC